MLAASLAVSLLALVVQPSAAGPLDHTKQDNPLFARTTCSINSESCVSSGSDSCCFEASNGLFVTPQFWDTDPPVGPADSWTIHGLWPDRCDGSFVTTCDPARTYPDPTSILRAAGRDDLITFMNNFWAPNTNKPPSSLWKNEWDRHGTCMSTLKPSCMEPGSPTGTDAVFYFDTTVKIFKTLPTYTWLAAAGITPSTSQTHTLSTLQAAIKASWGFTPAFDCNKNTNEVFQIYYYFHLKGSAIDGQWVPIDAPKAGSCKSSDIKYLPKKSAATTPIDPTGPSTPTITSAPPSTTIPARSTISALTSSGSVVGGLLSAGTWSVQTLATFRATVSGGGYTLTTSKGSCGVSSGTLSCGSGLTSTFTGTVSGSRLLLTFDGSTQFSANGVPSGATQQTVHTGTTGSQLIEFIINAS